MDFINIELCQNIETLAKLKCLVEYIFWTFLEYNFDHFF